MYPFDRTNITRVIFTNVTIAKANIMRTFTKLMQDKGNDDDSFNDSPPDLLYRAVERSR